MEDLYSTGISCSDHDDEIANFTQGSTTTGGGGGGGGFHHHHGGQHQVVVVEKLVHHHHQFQPPPPNNQIHRGSEHHQFSDHPHQHLIKAQIATHPRYPKLLSAYIECRKVGAPPEMASVLEEISKEIQLNGGSCEIGADPELDEFMESYCEVLIRYKEELSKPFDEATTFLNKIEIQLSNLCKGTTSTTTTTTTTTTSGSTHHSDEVAGSSEEELSCGEAEALESQESSGQRSGDQELKEMLLRKYSGYLSSLRKEFLKKRKKGKLPKDARVTLLDWWNTHYRWPYPTEEEKMKLAEVTGLDQKQINNWFINQRKRHWKPSEDMRFALMEGVTGGGGGGGPPAFFDTGEGGPGTDDLS